MGKGAKAANTNLRSLKLNMAEIQRSLVLLKPDAVQRALVGELIGRLERRGLKMVGLKMMKAAPALAEEHYAAHVGKPFFEGLVGFITSSPLVAMVVEGEGRRGVGPRDHGRDGPSERRARHGPGRPGAGDESKPHPWLGLAESRRH